MMMMMMMMMTHRQWNRMCQNNTQTNKQTLQLLTVSSLMATAATGAAWPLNCLTNTSSFKSQMIHVRSREPLTMMLYAADAVRHVTASLWPNSDFLRVRRRRCRPLPNSQTFTTWCITYTSHHCLASESAVYLVLCIKLCSRSSSPYHMIRHNT